MRPQFWPPPVTPSPAERATLRRLKRAKRFVFLRERRHALFDDACQTELAAPYAEHAAPPRRGHP